MNHSKIIDMSVKSIHQKPTQCILINSCVELINYIIDESKLILILPQQFSKFFAGCLNLLNVAVDIICTKLKQSIM